jgi:hypothetical protein
MNRHFGVNVELLVDEWELEAIKDRYIGLFSADDEPTAHDLVAAAAHAGACEHIFRIREELLASQAVPSATTATPDDRPMFSPDTVCNMVRDWFDAQKRAEREKLFRKLGMTCEPDGATWTIRLAPASGEITF